MSHDDFDFEPVRGVPAGLPPGETLLWQGTPQFRDLALGAFRARTIGFYFVGLAAIRGGDAVLAGLPWMDVLGRATTLLLLGAGAVAIVVALAWLSARATVYSITNRRVLIRHGIALQLTVNIPMATIEIARLRRGSDGRGDISFGLRDDERFAYLLNWPHVRPWRFHRPEPTLRALRDADSVVRLLGDLLVDGTSERVPTATTTRTPIAAPVQVAA